MLIRRFLPLLIFIGLFVAFMVGLTLNPREIPSARIGKPVPDFSLPPLEGDGVGLSTADMTDGDNIIIVNFFASWCGPCRLEHPSLMKLGQLDGVKLYGISYKDKPENSLSFLKTLGNPYVRVGMDLKGRNAIDWGVTGTPETFVVKNGIIRYQHIGPIYDVQVGELFLPLVKKLRQEGPS